MKQYFVRRKPPRRGTSVRLNTIIAGWHSTVSLEMCGATQLGRSLILRGTHP
jgi:hypothetical protein